LAGRRGKRADRPAKKAALIPPEVEEIFEGRKNKVSPLLKRKHLVQTGRKAIEE